MTDHDLHGCGRAGIVMGVLCAALGVLIAWLMIGPLKINRIIGLPRLPFELIVGLVALFLAAGFYGRKAGEFLCKRGNDLSTNVLIGVALAFGSIAIAVWAGTTVYIVRELLQHPFTGSGSMFTGLLLGWLLPLLVILIYGGVPAALLGGLFGFLMRYRLRSLRS